MATPVCRQCRRPIDGEYITALGGDWHPEHFVCGGCGKPIDVGGFAIHNSKPWHNQCFIDRAAPRCSLCNRPIMGMFLKGGWGEMYCPEHQARNAQCTFCDRITPSPKSADQDFDPPCPICGKTAVLTPEIARTLFHVAVIWAGRHGLAVPEAKVPIELVSRAQLARIMRGSGRRHLGVTRTNTLNTVFGIKVSTQVEGISFLRGMPLRQFQGVAAHELGHAWARLNGIDCLPEVEEEGFCEYLAWLWHHQNPTDENRFHENRIAANPDSIYGAGFRAVKALVDRRGFDAVRNHLLRYKRMMAA